MAESSWNVMAHSDAWEEKWRENKRMEWVTSKRHMTAEHRLAWAVQTLQADVHSSPASSRLNWRPRQFKWTCQFCRKTKSNFCACAITFQMQSSTSEPESVGLQDYELLLLQNYELLQKKFVLLLQQAHFVGVLLFVKGHAVAQLVEALRYKLEGRRFDSRSCHWNFSST